MSEINFSPFYVGQKVVALMTFGRTGVRIDDIFIVKGLKKCKCGGWNIDLGIKNIWANIVVCEVCDSELSKQKMWFDAKFFAPVQENFQSISLERVLETETPLISVN